MDNKDRINEINKLLGSNIITLRSGGSNINPDNEIFSSYELSLCENGELIEINDKCLNNGDLETSVIILGIINKENIIKIKDYLVNVEKVLELEFNKNYSFDYGSSIEFNIDGRKISTGEVGDHKEGIYAKTEQMLKSLAYDISEEDKKERITKKEELKNELKELVPKKEIEWDYDLDLPSYLVRYNNIDEASHE